MNYDIPVYKSEEFFARKTRYCFIVIVFNEAERIVRQLQRMKPQAAIADIVVADGNSTDGAVDANFLQSMQVRSKLVTEEKGLATAIRMGIHYAMEQGYEGIIMIDGNGKDAVEALPDFIAALDLGYDLVQGSRFMKGGKHNNTPLERYLGIRYVVAPIMALSGHYYSDPTNGFRAMSMRFLKDPRVRPIRSIFRRFNLQHYLIYRASKLKFKITEIPVTRSYPSDGSVPSKITKFSTKFLFIKELLATIIGRYNPKKIN